VEFWSTVTFRTDVNEEQAALDELMRQVSEQNAQLVEMVYRDGAIVVLPAQAHDLAEALQHLNLVEDQLNAVRRGIIAALAFNQHYVHAANHGWNPIEVAKRHHHE
jgi:hypothetical protein